MGNTAFVHMALAALFVLSCCGTAYNLFVSARLRRSGISFSTALNFLLLLARPDYYTEEGLKARRRTLAWFALGIATVVAFIVLDVAGLSAL